MLGPLLFSAAAVVPTAAAAWRTEAAEVVLFAENGGGLQGQKGSASTATQS